MKMYDYLVEWGIEFENQKKVNPYVLDFYIPSLKTCIEVDGFEEHKNRKLYDKLRDEYILLKHKIKTYRFAGWRVNRYPNACIYVATECNSSKMSAIGKSEIVKYLTTCEGISIDRAEHFINTYRLD